VCERPGHARGPGTRSSPPRSPGEPGKPDSFTGLFPARLPLHLRNPGRGGGWTRKSPGGTRRGPPGDRVLPSPLRPRDLYSRRLLGDRPAHRAGAGPGVRGAVMPENESIVGLFRRVRSGDPQAAAELFRVYEPAIRRRVRLWLRMQDERLRRVFDSVDVCQSVLASFFIRAAAGQYDVQEPGQLIALLVRMAKH